jgi:hypothetical protein
LKSPNVSWAPKLEKDNKRYHGNSGAGDVDDPRSMEITPKELCDAESQSSNEACGPDFDRRLPSRHSQITQNGTMNENTGSCRPTIPLSSRSGSPVTPANAMMGVPRAPKATGAVLPMRHRPAAWRGANPSPMSIAAEIATGVPNPAAPSMKAPKQYATSNTCMRRSSATLAIDNFTVSNVPVNTVMS